MELKFSFKFKAYLAMDICKTFKSGAATGLEDEVLSILEQELRLDRKNLVIDSIYDTGQNQHMVVHVRKRRQAEYFAVVFIRHVSKLEADRCWRQRFREYIRGVAGTPVRRTEPSTLDIDNGGIDFSKIYNDRY